MTAAAAASVRNNNIMSNDDKQQQQQQQQHPPWGEEAAGRFRRRRSLLLQGLFAAWSLFSIWYTNWKGPLTPDEIDRYIELFRTNNDGEYRDDHKKIKILRDFMESD